MALVKGKFVDKDQLIQANSDPVDEKDLARKSYVDSQAAGAAAAKIEDAIVDGVTDKAPSQNAVYDALALKQASLGTGTTSQFLRGDLTWAEVPTSVGVAQTKIVSKSGNDTTGDGTFTKPFATIAAAMASITDATPSKRYIVKVEAGAYTEGALALKANVFIVGDLKEAVRVTASSVALASDFSGSADNRSGMGRIILAGACNFDWDAVTSQAGKLYFTEVSFSNTLNLKGYNNAIAQAQFNDCVMFGAVTISGINVGVFKDNFVFTNVTLNQHASLPSIINVDGGTCDTLRFNASVNDFNRRSSGFVRNFQSQNLIVDGPSAYCDYTLESGSKTGAQSLNGGNLVPLTPKLSQDLETKMLKPISNNAHNLGDWGKQWFFNFAYVHASAGTDMYILSAMENYDPAGDSSGKSIYITPDGYGLQTNVSGGNVEIETAAVSGTGVRGKVKINARELDMTSAKITNVADPTANQDAATKKYVDDEIGAIDVSGVVEDAIVDGVTNKAPSQNAVYDALALKLDQTTKGAANGVAELDGSGKVPSSQLPAIAVTDTFVVASEAAMLALTAEKGDVAVRTDLSKSFILSGSDASVLADWTELLTPTDAVLSVNGQTGSVSLDTDDISEGATNKYFSDAAAKAAAVVNSTAGSETDQAASVDAMKSYVAAEIAAIPAPQMPQGKKERKVLTSTDISNGYIDCAFEAMADTMMVMTGGVVHNEGSGDDYVLSIVGGVTRISFEPDLAAILADGDDIYLQYLRLA